jgi:signal transduction histidine kinase
VQILVADNGIGFDEIRAEHLFEPFERLVGKNQSEYEGIGMGLAICRWIVERHGGEITARSNPGLGTTFIFSLPVRQTANSKNRGMKELNDGN